MAEAFNALLQLDVWSQILLAVGLVGTAVAIAALLKNHDEGERK